jgi:hypothetical protein
MRRLLTCLAIAAIGIFAEVASAGTPPVNDTLTLNLPGDSTIYTGTLFQCDPMEGTIGFVVHNISMVPPDPIFASQLDTGLMTWHIYLCSSYYDCDPPVDHTCVFSHTPPRATVFDCVADDTE